MNLASPGMPLFDSARDSASGCKCPSLSFKLNFESELESESVATGIPGLMMPRQSLALAVWHRRGGRARVRRLAEPQLTRSRHWHWHSLASRG